MSRRKISQNKQPIKKKSPKKNRRADKAVSLPLRYRLLMLACGFVLVVGFFFAARQHFASVDISMKNSRLRKMSEELEADKRRLLLAKEIALSPAELKKAAQKIGFTKAAASGGAQTARAQVAAAASKTGRLLAEKSADAKLKQTLAENVERAIAEVKPAVKKLIETKSPDSREKRETVRAEK